MAKKQTLSQEQDFAANPQKNVWVQANAGTGKTSVLVQRLLRILFRSERLDANGILCLTYTNAAAGEMRNRILAALRKWAMASDEDLCDLLDGIAINKPAKAGDIARAREIFFFYIDNPDVLKIKTIHGFCEEVLHRFPVEAGLVPAWSLISDDAQRILLQDSFDKLINSPAQDTKTSDAFAHIVTRISEVSMPKILKLLSEQYKHFFGVDNLVKYRTYFIETTKKFLNVENTVSDVFDPKTLGNIVENAILDQNGRKSPAGYLTKIINLTKQYIEKTIDFEKYKFAYLTKEGTVNKNVLRCGYLLTEADRVYELNQYKINLLLFQDTVALFDLSMAFTSVYREMKAAKNVLDFEDLILYTRKLFSNPSTMGWVLSQLEYSLSHILVDEAQDTSPVQWDILRMLVGDFFADGDTQGDTHSMFVVGDTKQSIYGFQGADPRAFATSRDAIAVQIQNNLRAIHEIPLAQSFRSSPQVLYAVDRFFDDSELVAKTGFSNTKHKCFWKDLKGVVELNRLVSKRLDETTVDEYVLNIALRIRDMVSSGELKPAEIMVLVRNRHPMAPRLVKELKRLGIDVAGSDRIVLPDFSTVRDLMNLTRFCLDRTDDFSLCCVLKSPIYRLSEHEIFKVCEIKNRENEIRHAANPDFVPMTVFEVLETEYPDIYSDLVQILQWGETLSPYSFFTNVLNHNDVRAKMVSALGNQIIDPLEEFLTICLAYERTQPGTLYHFLKYFVTGNSQIKRDMDASSGVRVVTVHGSKGLEAKAVFLIDTTDIPSIENIVPVPGNSDAFPEPWLWAPQTSHSSAYADAKATEKDVAIAEYYRLLYVAMTRAREQLYIYGFTSDNNANEMSWHSQLWRVFQTIPNAEITDDKIRITNVDPNA